MIGQYLYLAFSLGQLTPEFSTLLLQHHVLLLDLVKITLGFVLLFFQLILVLL
jgi:hypothetical protein